MDTNLPPNLSALVRLCEPVRPFMELCQTNEMRMNAAVQELRKISDHIKKSKKSKVQTFVGIVIGLVSVGLSFVETISFSLVSTLFAMVGTSVVWSANSKRVEMEAEIIEKIGLLEEFKNIIEPQQNALKEVQKMMCEVYKRSTLLRPEIGQQAATTLSEIDRVLQLHQEMKELTANAKAKFCLTQLVEQCEKTLEEVLNMRRLLKDFAD